MTKESPAGHSPLLLLKLRSAIADKEFVTAAANHETATYGEWQTDHYTEQMSCEQEIQNLINQIQAAALAAIEEKK